ncbi:MAG: CarD family transcriptional regulator [[Clostridium] leptum]
MAAAALRDDLPPSYSGCSRGTELTRQSLRLSGSLSGGMELPELKFALITHGKAATKTVKRKKSKKPGEQIRSLSDLTFGDYVVHAAHGIGVFEGVVKREIHGVTKDYIKIHYAGLTRCLFR